jgi:hypothetical protein
LRQIYDRNGERATTVGSWSIAPIHLRAAGGGKQSKLCENIFGNVDCTRVAKIDLCRIEKALIWEIFHSGRDTLHFHIPSRAEYPAT